MKTELYPYQKTIVEQDRKWSGIFLGTGVGKTRIGLELMKGRTLVICPKQQFLENMWEEKRMEFEIEGSIRTVSKEWFRAHWEELELFDTVIVDECHHFLGVQADTRTKKGVEYPKASQMYEALYLYLKRNPPERLYLCSATPVSKPMNLYALARLLGHSVDYFKFRAKYYVRTMMGQRRVWLQKTDDLTKDLLADGVKRLGYVGKMQDFVDVPEQTHLMPSDIPYIELTTEQRNAILTVQAEEADPMVSRARQRTIANGVLYGKKVTAMSEFEDYMEEETTIFTSNKIEEILKYAEEFPKMLIFANWTAQIETIAMILSSQGYKVSTLTGKTKDRKKVITEADADDAHIVVAQCTISEGYELPSIPCVIYASKSWQFLHYEQSLGRVLRRNKLKKNLYIHLVTRGVDDDCHKAIMSGKDFQERLTALA